MLRKTATYFGIIALVFLILAPKVLSQGLPGPEFNKVFGQYSQKLEDYRNAHDDYLLARSQYLKFKTLTAQNNAKVATLTMLQARDDVVIYYLRSLVERVKEIEGMDGDTRKDLLSRIDGEISWFSEHKGKLSSAGSLEDLVSDSDKAKEQHRSIEPLIYEALAEIPNARVSHFRERLNKIFSTTADKVNTIKSEERLEYKFSTRKIQVIDRWIFETENMIGRSEEKQNEAKDEISEASSRGRGDEKTLNQVLQILGESQQYLKEASSFVKEIIREIMTAE